MLHDEDSDQGKKGPPNLSVLGLVFIALMFFLIAAANVYMQDNRDGANGNASVVKSASPAAR